MDARSWERGKQILAEAVEMPKSARESFIQSACADDNELAAELLELLGAADSTSRDLLERSPAPRHLDPLHDLQTGTRIGQYTIIDRLGRGGMGQVFLAADSELRRKVALKCLLEAQATGVDRRRIIQEAIAAAAINHGNVATIYHVVEHNARAFIVMEYVPGETLSATLLRQRMPVDRLVQIGRQLAAALKAAHARGVVHRDIKPGNVQVTLDGSVKVLDFGVARAARGVVAPSGATTSLGAPNKSEPSLPLRGGTPAYMSPEQLASGRVDERSDLYSLGVLLFEMATGKRPFPTSDTDELIEAQRHGTVRADAVDRRVPRLLADVIEKALQPDLKARCQTAVELDEGLAAVQRELEEQAARKTWRDLVLRWLARLGIWVPVAIVALLGLGLVVTVGYNTTFGRTGPYARFGAESWRDHLTWGILAAFPSVFIMTLTAGAAVVLRFVFRTLGMFGPIAGLTRPVRARLRQAALALELDTPAGLAQALAAGALVTLAGVFWYDNALIGAWTSFFDTAPIAALMPMGESIRAVPRQGQEGDEMRGMVSDSPFVEAHANPPRGRGAHRRAEASD